MGDAELEVTQVGKTCHTRCAIYVRAGDCIMPRLGLFARVVRGGEEVELTAKEFGLLRSLLDTQAEVTLPILQPGDSLLDMLHRTADRYVEFLEQYLPLDSLMTLTGVGRRYTFTMAYRDVGWWILDELVRGGEIEIPPALQPGAGSDASLRGVVALVPVYAPFADQLRTAVAGR